MRKLRPLKLLLGLILVCACISASNAQCSITSSNGYTVHVSLTPVAIVPATTNCPYGYSYEVQYNYALSFTGTNIPSSLNTFQATFTCGGNTSGDYSIPLTSGSGTRTTTNNQYRSQSDCNTVTPSICTAASVTVGGPGISTQTFTCPMVPLPIKLARFSADHTEKGIHLDWETSMEVNFSHFEVERSGADLNFTILHSVEGKGALQALTSYNFLDHDPNSGRNYYRLKCVDTDGTVAYSHVVTATWSGKKEGIAIYPNPTTGRTISLQQSQDLGFPMRLSIISVLGDVVYEQTVEETETQILLPENINPGMYVARVITPLTEKRISLIVN